MGAKLVAAFTSGFRGVAAIVGLGGASAGEWEGVDALFAIKGNRELNAVKTQKPFERTLSSDL